jgi:HPt (histidine-containing phosphotransfer) domain-containing protein
MSDTSPLDPRVLATLRELSGPDQPDLHLRLARKYVEGGRSALARLRGAVEGGDFGAAREAAHELKGSSGNMGAMTLHALCSDVELAARDRRAELEAIAPLEAEFERVVEALTDAFGL